MFAMYVPGTVVVFNQRSNPFYWKASNRFVETTRVPIGRYTPVYLCRTLPFGIEGTGGFISPNSSSSHFMDDIYLPICLVGYVGPSVSVVRQPIGSSRRRALIAKQIPPYEICRAVRTDWSKIHTMYKLSLPNSSRSRG